MRNPDRSTAAALEPYNDDDRQRSAGGKILISDLTATVWDLVREKTGSGLDKPSSL
ncbi:MAG: hypothetical protein LZF62_240166 [Nitrospira sp.]|nr:MAG: hypothetical protein LZF62_240166 [Nitrospira sp.]